MPLVISLFVSIVKKKKLLRYCAAIFHNTQQIDQPEEFGLIIAPYRELPITRHGWDDGPIHSGGLTMMCAEEGWGTKELYGVQWVRRSYINSSIEVRLEVTTLHDGEPIFFFIWNKLNHDPTKRKFHTSRNMIEYKNS